MINIKKEKIVSFKADITFLINGKALLVHPEIELEPLFISKNKTDIYLFCTYSIVPDQTPDGTNMDVNYTIRFLIENAKEVSSKDLFECVIQTKYQLQLVFNEIFFSEADDAKPLVPSIDFEDVEDYLNIVAEKTVNLF